MNLILASVVIAMHSMPAWMIISTNSLWSLKVRKSVLLFLVVLVTVYYAILFANLNPKLFSDIFTLSISVTLLVINWMITIYRAYRLWPREDQ
jgi:hypothetical protein